MRITNRLGRGVLFLAAVAGAAALPALLGSAPVAAGEGETARLLVKCPKDEVQKVLAALGTTKAEVYDLDTMKRLVLPGKAGPLPPLADAGRVMRTCLGIVSKIAGQGQHGLLQIDEMAIRERRAVLKIVVVNRGTIDVLRRAIANDAYLTARATTVALGREQSVPGNRFKQSLSLHFRNQDGVGKEAPVPTSSIPANVVQSAASAASMQMIFASAVMDDPNRTKGWRTVSREYTFKAATLQQLIQLIDKLGQGAQGLTVTELRWKRDGKSQGPPIKIAKPILKLAGRAPLSALLGSLPVAAEEGETARLLVKCPKDEVPKVLAALSGGKVEVYDLDTMKRLALSGRPGPLAPLADAGKVMHTCLDVVDKLNGQGQHGRIDVDEMAVNERRATLKAIVDKPRALDMLRKALAANSYLKARRTSIALGALQNLPNNRFKQSVALKFSEENGVARGAVVSATSIPTHAVASAANVASMQRRYASAESNNPNRSRGWRTVSREFTFGPATLTQLLKLIDKLSADAQGLTVTEVRWKRDAKAAAPPILIQKPVIRVAGRAPLTR